MTLSADDRRGEDRESAMLTMVFETLRRLDDRLTAHGAEARAGFADMRKLLDLHIKDDDDVADRVLVLEKAREFDEKQSVRRGTWVALLVTGLCQVLIWGFRKVLGL